MDEPEPRSGTSDAPWTAWGDDDPAPAPRSRRVILLAVALIPWMVVAALLARPATGPATPSAVALEPATEGSSPSTSSPPQGSAPPAAAPSPGPSGSAISPDEGSLTATTLRSAARHGPDVGDAITVAVLVARAWFTGTGPGFAAAHEDLDAQVPGYVEHLWVEAVDAPWRDHVVVTLGALVLVGEPDGSLRPVARRLAVPVALDASGARAAGPAYALRAPGVTYEPLVFEAVENEALALAAADALSEAGYEVDAVLELSRSDGWPWRARLEGTAPGEDAPREHQVWLRQHVGAFVVAGWLPVPDVAAHQEVVP